MKKNIPAFKVMPRSVPLLVVCTALGYILLALLKGSFAFAADDNIKDKILADEQMPWQITADRISHLEQEGIVVAEGDVVISRGGQTLSAQSARFFEKTGIVKISGDVRLEANGDILTAESGEFNLNNNSGRVKGGRLFLNKNHYYVSGETIERVDENTYIVREGHLTTCDGDNPVWSITSREVKVKMEGNSTIKGATFRFKNIPIFYLPYAIFPGRSQRQTGFLLPRVGYTDRNGMDVEIPFFWAISPQTDATIYERYMHRRGLMQGAEFRYVAEKDSKGAFLFDILSDDVETKDLSDPEEVNLSPFPRTNETRYWLRSRTDQHLPFAVRARLDTDFVSDQDYLKEFRGGLFGYEVRPNLVEESGRPLEEVQSPTRRSALRLSRDGFEYSLQAVSEFHERPENPPDDDTAQPLAGVGFTILPRPFLLNRLFFDLETDYDHVWRESGQKGQSFSINPALTYPMFFGRYLQFEPSVQYTRDLLLLEDSPTATDRQTKDAYRIGARLSSVVERIFSFEWKDTTKLKHKVTPSLTYEFRAPREQEGLAPWFEPIDVEGKINRITLSVENFLDARRQSPEGAVSYKQWGTLSFSQGYNIEEVRREDEPFRKKEPFEPLKAFLSLTPYPDLDVDMEAHWDHVVDDITFADLSIELGVDRAGGMKDRYGVDFQYTEGGRKSLSYSIHLNLTNGLAIGTALKRDLEQRNTVESSYWIDYQSQCWGLRISAEELDDVGSIMLNFRLTGLGDLSL